MDSNIVESVVIRQAYLNDLSQYTEFAQQMFEKTYVAPELGLYPEHFSKEIFNNDETQEYLKSNLLHDDTHMSFLAFESLRLVGAVSAEIRDGEVEARGFYVEPDFRGRGLGKQLWSQVEKFAQGKDIILEIYAHNTRTIKMYESWGFERDVTRGEDGYFDRHWPEWPAGLSAKSIFMRKKHHEV